MPIEKEGQIIWIDCADDEQVPKDNKNDLVPDFPSPISNSPGPSINSPKPSLTAIGGVPAREPPVNVETDNTEVPAETDKMKVHKKSFMTDYWSLDLIGDPQNPAEKSIPGIHPQWEEILGIFQFVDPSTKEWIAHWDYTHGLPRFYKYGYLWVHPKIKGKFAWAWSPLEDPFAAERGM